MEQSELYELLSFLISFHCQIWLLFSSRGTSKYTAGTLNPGGVAPVALSMESTKNESLVWELASSTGTFERPKTGVAEQ